MYRYARAALIPSFKKMQAEFKHRENAVKKGQNSSANLMPATSSSATN